jgi:Ca2+-binding RTX toxin-like protein
VKGRTRISLLAACLAAFALAAPATASAVCNGLTPTQTGTAAGETINGTAGIDVIEGGGGNDTINGLGGNDTICGEEGDDTIDGGSGSDHMQGGTTGQTSGDTVTFVSVTVQLMADLQAQTATNTSGDSDAILQFENLTGTNTFDLLRGDGGPNVITGLDAADGFQGRGGDDTLIDPSFPVDQGGAEYTDATGPVSGSVGAGTRTITGAGVGTDTLTNVRSFSGSNFDDQIIGDASDQQFVGLGGNDLFEPLSGLDSVTGGGGTDTVSYASESGPIVGDLSSVEFGNISAPGGNDSTFEVENLIGSAQDDQVTGGTENNVFDGRGGADQLNGGAGGSDTAAYSGIATGVTANLTSGTATGQGSDTLTNIDNLIGSSESDSLIGDGNSNTLDGGGSGDNLEGLGGNDTLSDPTGGDQDSARYENSPGPGGIVADLVAGTVNGTAAGAGSDTLSGVLEISGTNFDDVMTGDANDNLFTGRSGNDLFAPLGGADIVNDNAGTDTISYAAEMGPIVTADLSSGNPGNVTAPGGNDQVFGVENLIGSAQDDQVTGGSESNVFDGLGGNDTLNGGTGGSDTASFAVLGQFVDANLATGAATGQGTDTLTNIDNLTGSSQGDFLTGDANNNVFNGGSGGVDTVRFSGVLQGVNASLLTNTATGQGSDSFGGIENLTGSDQDDTLTGDAGPNGLAGRDGADNITGGLGVDGFFLGAGTDSIVANDGVVDTIDCEGGGPDSGQVDGPAPAENYITDCDSDADALVDFLDACPSTSGTGADGCVPSVVVTPVQTTPTTPAAPSTKKCKKGFVKKKVKGKKKCVKKKKRK